MLFVIRSPTIRNNLGGSRLFTEISSDERTNELPCDKPSLSAPCNSLTQGKNKVCHGRRIITLHVKGTDKNPQNSHQKLPTFPAHIGTPVRGVLGTRHFHRTITSQGQSGFYHKLCSYYTHYLVQDPFITRVQKLLIGRF